MKYVPTRGIIRNEWRDICVHEDGESKKMIPDLFRSVRPNGLSWQQDRIRHHSLWIGTKETEEILLVWKPSWEQQLGPAAAFLLVKVPGFVEKCGDLEKKRKTAPCTLMGLGLGLGDSTYDAVEDSKVLQKRSRRQRVHFILPERKKGTSARSQTFNRHGILTGLLWSPEGTIWLCSY